jgi:SAM-dependent methyltransferase
MNLEMVRHPHQRLLTLYALRIRLDPRSWGGPHALVKTSFRVMLRRSADPEELATWVGRLERGELVWTGLIWQLLCSAEFRRLHPEWSLPRDDWPQIQQAIHKARCLLVQKELPAADTIVDLGGACTEAIEGALLWMGYPHPVREITIIEVPPEKRMFADTFAHVAEEGFDWIDVGQTRVRYLHGSMVDMSALADESVDMVWSGETIEHVTPQEARQVYGEALRVLKPGGYFCLDTPNRALTRLENPGPRGFIHPEHKHEYMVPELVAHLDAAGFQVRRTLGICPMARAVREGRIDFAEILEHGGLSEDAEQAFLFYVESVKPGV